jgi:hypothetical protein
MNSEIDKLKEAYWDGFNAAHKMHRDILKILADKSEAAFEMIRAGQIEVPDEEKEGGVAAGVDDERMS